MDRPTDDLLRRILAAAAATTADAPAVQRLVAEARTAAENDVKALLTSAFKASLLRAAADHLDGATTAVRSPPPLARSRNLARTSGADAEQDGSPADPSSPAPSATETRHGPCASQSSEQTASTCYVYAITADDGPQSWWNDTTGVD